MSLGWVLCLFGRHDLKVLDSKGSQCLRCRVYRFEED